MFFSFDILIRYQYHILKFNSVFRPNYRPKLSNFKGLDSYHFTIYKKMILETFVKLSLKSKHPHYESSQLILCYLLFMLRWQLLLILNKATVRSNYYFLSFRSGKQSFALHLSNFLSQNITTLINPRTTVMA